MWQRRVTLVHMDLFLYDLLLLDIVYGTHLYCVVFGINDWFHGDWVGVEFSIALGGEEWPCSHMSMVS